VFGRSVCVHSLAGARQIWISSTCWRKGWSVFCSWLAVVARSSLSTRRTARCDWVNRTDRLYGIMSASRLPGAALSSSSVDAAVHSVGCTLTMRRRFMSYFHSSHVTFWPQCYQRKDHPCSTEEPLYLHLSFCLYPPICHRNVDIVWNMIGKLAKLLSSISELRFISLAAVCF